ncbi:hypothetical protein GCM10020254_68800 [Streptomyces goshikiensis]
MARRPLPRILISGTASLARGRDFARTAADSATDVLHPLLVIGRGLRVLASAGRRKWAGTPKDKRGPALFLGAACVLVVALVPYGPLLALITLMAAAAWQGRARTPVKTGPSEAETERLGSLYEALVPYFSIPEDPNPPSSPTAAAGTRPSAATSSTRRAASPGCASATRPTSPMARPPRGPGSRRCCTPSPGADGSTASTGTRRATSST